ncbi:protealysin inhibitor emfourin [Streptomyces sp. CA-294286]|uniref:protealysin inhibitor emfourin n=1 Tax=Streptomyces sp. CA-294286 TaxID=3240070 RepID=UPI003D903E2B
MRIEVVRSGGFAGIERRAEVDTSCLPDAEAWHALAAEALASGRDARPEETGIADGFCYEITVDGRTVHFSEPQLGEQQRELITRVLKEGA